MADNSILTPGCDDVQLMGLDSNEITDTSGFLIKENYLGEFYTEDDKAIVRVNLDIPSNDSVYTKQETDSNISTTVSKSMLDHLNLDDPHGILPQVESKIDGMVKLDGSTPFLAPLKGVAPITDDLLTTKKFVADLLKTHTTANDPHGILPEVKTLLLNYVKSSDVYSKSEVYTKKEADALNKLYVKRDGSTSFTKPQLGVDPQVDSHLATKRYVDKLLYQHAVDADPHGFISILNNRLAKYAKADNVYDKTLTYSRVLLDNIINKAVADAVLSVLDNYSGTIDSKIQELTSKGIIYQDGSVNFTQPLAGVPAVESNQLVTLSQLEDAQNLLLEQIDLKEPMWQTSGPVEATVGKVDEGFEFSNQVSMLEVLDAIFYGSKTSITAPDTVILGESADLVVCVHGSISKLVAAEVKQNGVNIATLSASDFKDSSCVTITSDSILEDTVFELETHFQNGAIHHDTATVICSQPIFVGLLPKWEQALNITMKELKSMAASDKDGTKNRFINSGRNLTEINFHYTFEDANLREPMLVIPADYPLLDMFKTRSQSFTADAFEKIYMILDVPTMAGKTAPYYVYVFKNSLARLDEDVTFTFKTK